MLSGSNNISIINNGTIAHHFTIERKFIFSRYVGKLTVLWSRDFKSQINKACLLPATNSFKFTFVFQLDFAIKLFGVGDLLQHFFFA